MAIFHRVEKPQPMKKRPDIPSHALAGATVSIVALHMREAHALRRCAASTSDLILVVDFECALHENLVERECQAIDGQNRGSSRPAPVRYERKRNISARAEACDFGYTGKRSGILVHISSGDFADHIHGVHRELATMWTVRRLGRKRQTIKLARDAPIRALSVEGYRRNHGNKTRRACSLVNNRRASASRD